MSDTDIASLRERLRARLEQVRVRIRDLELDATLIRGRTEETREEEAALLEMLDDSPRRRGGRPRKATAGLTMINEPAWDGQPPAIVPQRVAGASAETETDEQLFPEEAAQ